MYIYYCITKNRIPFKKNNRKNKIAWKKFIIQIKLYCSADLL